MLRAVYPPRVIHEHLTYAVLVLTRRRHPTKKTHHTNKIKGLNLDSFFFYRSYTFKLVTETRFELHRYIPSGTLFICLKKRLTVTCREDFPGTLSSCTLDTITLRLKVTYVITHWVSRSFYFRRKSKSL